MLMVWTEGMVMLRSVSASERNDSISLSVLRSRGTLGPVIHSAYPYPTYGGVGPASGGLQGARRLAYAALLVQPEEVR